MIEPGPHLGHGGTEVHAAEPDFNHAHRISLQAPRIALPRDNARLAVACFFPPGEIPFMCGLRDKAAAGRPGRAWPALGREKPQRVLGVVENPDRRRSRLPLAVLVGSAAQAVFGESAHRNSAVTRLKAIKQMAAQRGYPEAACCGALRRAA
jgi:hypothetical protein